MKKLYVFAAIVMVASLVLAACGPTPEPEIVEVTKMVEKEVVVTQVVVEQGEEKIVEVTRVVKEEVPVEVQVEVTAAPLPTPKGGYVTFLVTSDFVMLNPILRNSAATGLMYGSALYDDPFSSEPVPYFTTGWDISDDGLHYTMHVREGMTWTDGTPVTAKDYAFTWQALKSGVLESEYTEDAKFIEEINLIDDYTVEFVMTKVDCTALYKIRLGWLPAHMYAEDFSDVMESQLLPAEAGSLGSE